MSSRYHEPSPVEYLEKDIHIEKRSTPRYDYLDSRNMDNGLPTGLDYRDSNRGALVRPAHSHHAPTVIEEPLIEHEHHHLHHHIDHGNVNDRLVMTRANRPGVTREYSYDDLDLRERRYSNGTSVSQIQVGHDHGKRRHRHRHRSRNGSQERTRITRSEIDLSRAPYDDDEYSDDVTVVDVPAGTRRVYVNVEKGREPEPEREYSENVDWRKQHGVRRSRGLGDELWTEITKDLVAREAIEELGYQFDETDFFYYIFEFLDRDQIAELRELTDELRHERVRDIEYQSIAGSNTPRMLPSREFDFDRIDRRDRDVEDSRTEIIIEKAHSSRSDRPRRRYHS